MAMGAQLEQTIDKILEETEKKMLSNIRSAVEESGKSLDDAVLTLEQEYDRILSDGRKEADKIHRQIVGSSDLDVRNRQLLVLEEAVDNVFAKALEQVSSIDRNGAEYTELVRSLLAESTAILGSKNVLVSAGAADRDVVQSILSADYPDSELAQEGIDCLGGVRIRSRDGSMMFDNTLDARIERLKPLIRKEIASKFGADD